MEGYYIYRFLNKNKSIIYLGRTTNLRIRLNSQHFTDKGHLPKRCYDETVSIEYSELKNESEMKIYELYLINKYNPIYNSKDKNKDIFSFELPDLRWKEYSNFSNENTKIALDFNFNKYAEKLLKKYDLHKIIEFANLNNESFGINDVVEQVNESSSLINLKLNLLVLLGILEKINRRVRCYKISTQFDSSYTENISLVFLKNKMNLKDITYIRINALFGNEISNKIFPMTKQNEATLPYCNQIIDYVKKIIDKFGWMTEIQLKEYIKSLGIKNSYLKLYTDYLAEELGIKRMNCNKHIKQMFDIKNDVIPLESFPVMLIPSKIKC